MAQCFGIIYTPDFLKGFGFGSYNGSLWTISVELQFYIILPMMYWLMKKLVKTEKGKTFIILLATVIFAVVAIISAMYFTAVNFDFETRIQKLVRYSFVPHIYLFLLGNLLYRCKAYKSDLIFNKGLVWICAFLLVLWLFPPGYAKPILTKIVLGITTISIAYTRPGFAENILRSNDISYGVYIYHGLIVGLLVELKTEQVLSVMITFAGAYILGFLSWKLIEQPVLSLKKKSLHSVKPTNGIKMCS
jgi:peptidoglycan/LPS O-acetylase OafA/YrhL